MTLTSAKSNSRKVPIVLHWNLSLIAIIQFTLASSIIPSANAQMNFDDDAYGTLIKDADNRIKELKKMRIEREKDLVREDEEAKLEDLMRTKRPVFGSRNIPDDDDDDDDKDDLNKSKIFSASVKKRPYDRRMNVTLKLDVDDDDQLDSMKSDRVKKDDKEDEESEKERDEEERKLAKRRAERKAAFDDRTDKPYFEAHWVPDDYDPTSNGGFGVDDGNGRPVPYNLNGFPNLQRGMPWDLND